MKLLRPAHLIYRPRAFRGGAISRSLAAVALMFSLFTLMFSPTAAYAQTASQTAAPDKNDYRPGEVLVKYRDPSGGRRVNNLGLQPERLLAEPLLGNQRLTRFKALSNMPGYFHFSADSQADVNKLVAALSLDPAIEFAEPNYKYSLNRVPNDPLYNQVLIDPSGAEQYRQWYLKKIGIESFWDYTTGINHVIAILDTGIDGTHEDLAGRIDQARSMDFTTLFPRSLSFSPNSDDNGHGTAVAGVIAAKGDNGRGIAGINWNAILLPVKVLDADGNGSSLSVSQGVVYAADNRARIINLSLGGKKQSKVEEGAIRYAQNKGVLVVVSAGNDPDTSPNYPALFSNVIAVGASDQHDRPAGFTSVGTYVSVAAPGADIFTTYCNFFITGACEIPASHPYPRNVGCNNNDINDCYNSGESLYVYIDGTSFSAPIVAGLASLIISYRPDIGNDVIRNLIEGTADDIDAPGRDNRTGYGRVNAARIAQALVNENFLPNRHAVVQGRVTSAQLTEIVVNLSPPNINQPVNSSGGFRFDALGPGDYYLRIAVPARSLTLGPAIIHSTGGSGEVYNVNVDVDSQIFICGPRVECPKYTGPAPGKPPLEIPSGAIAPVFKPQAALPGKLYFPETGHNLGGEFRTFWERNGGLAIFGFPLSEEFQEVSPTDGRTYTVQYFQRNRFEFHPEKAAPYRVLLGLLGNELTVGRFFPPVSAIGLYFPETGHTLSGRFLEYWRSHGGLAIFGYPISAPLQEGGMMVQYFQRNRFEYHPEHAGTRYEVLLGLLGVDLARKMNYIQ